RRPCDADCDRARRAPPSFPTRRSSDLTSTELTPDFAAALGRGFAAYLQEKCPGAQSIALGRDHRTSSPALAREFSRGVREGGVRSEEHTSELQSRFDLVCRLLLEKKKR